MQNHHPVIILNAFQSMLGATDDLCAQIKADSLPIWVADKAASRFESNLSTLTYALKKLTPASDSSAPQETYCCPGAVAATQHTLELVQCVNTAKQTFKAAALLAQQELGHKTHKIIRELLISHGYGLVKLMQAYRHFHVIHFQPRRIAWSMGTNSTNVIINQAQAQALLLKLGQGTHIDSQLAKLNLLAKDEPLVINRSLKPNWVVNISTVKDGGRSIFHNLRTSLPVFYLYDPALLLPEVCFSSKVARITHKPRADKLLEDEPFLPSIHAFRYKNFQSLSL